MHLYIHVGGNNSPVMITLRAQHLFLFGDVVEGLDFVVSFSDAALEYGAIQHDVVTFLKRPFSYSELLYFIEFFLLFYSFFYLCLSVRRCSLV